jgi:predicted DNA-binding protein (UPF0251 family)
MIVGRLRERGEELEQAVFAAVCAAVPEPSDGRDAEYAAGLRAAVAAAIDYGLAGIERGGGWPRAIPPQAVAQARRAARSGVSLDAVLRRYVVGHGVLWDYVMQETDRAERAGHGTGLRELFRGQASALDELIIGVTREYGGELARAGRSRERGLIEQVRALLAGGPAGATEGGAQRASSALGYELDATHVAVIARGVEAREALHELAARVDRRLLSVAAGEETVWAWLGGEHSLEMAQLEHAVRELDPAGGGPRDRGCSQGKETATVDASLATGEPATGLEGWRLTHQQAQAALAVALRKPQHLTRYADVALLAAVLKDQTLARSLSEIYLRPLQETPSSGGVLLQTLRAYLAAERNASSAAAALGVARNTVENRLRAAEARLGRSLHPCPAELEVALRLGDLPNLTTQNCAHCHSAEPANRL